MKSTTPSITQQSRRWSGALGALPPAVALALVLLAARPAPSAQAARTRARTASVTLTRLAVDGAQITIGGRVSLPIDTAAERRRTAVWVTLSAPGELAEHWILRLDSHERFSFTHATRLSGSVSVAISIRLTGKALGRRLLKTIAVSAPAGAVSPGSPSGTGPTATGPTGTVPSGTPPTTYEGPLDGTLELETGREVSGRVTGSWFEMFDPPTWTTPLENGNSPLKDQDYTPLSPGTDGGLETFAYEPAPSPAYNNADDPLFDEIMQPQSFFGDNFSVLTEASDPQTNEADPLPAIVDDKGQLSGQITAWAVGWNGQWFNQGSPKPNGTLPAGSTAVSGTYDAATGHYLLEWKSLIVGGAFTNHAGLWHLEGTFVPAG